MLAAPTQDTFTVGEVLTAALMNKNVRDAVNFLQSPPLFVGYQNVSQSIPSGSNNALTWDSEAVDNYGGHSTSSNTSRYTAQIAGWYLWVASIRLSNNATGCRQISPFVNGTSAATATFLSKIDDAANQGTAPLGVGMVYLKVGDYVESVLFQNSGATLSSTGSALASTAVLWVSS